ncbi:MAG: hypothetical protein UT00_C0015G0005 [Parcubacteria group bacterium GW2011_GWA1_38_7]|nr:MAG: hypothetical protein UT00_C0015G0005 [Parcubacteria group bacterium GW2011_GWA1_38_7]
MFHAAFLITIGFLLLLNNFNYLPWSIWQNLIAYWPVLIIFAGIDVILGKSIPGKIASGLINTIIFLAIVARVTGFNLPYINSIPLPKRNNEIIPFIYTDKDNFKFKFDKFNQEDGLF